MRVLAGFGDDDVIARDEVDVSRTVQMVPEEDPKQESPREDRGEKALDGAIAAAWARPAGHAEHGEASGHYQESAHYPTALAQGSCRYVGLQALQECYNVHCGLLRRVRVEVRDDINSTLLQKPMDVRQFWRRYCKATEVDVA
jgi:hypothetical protein